MSRRNQPVPSRNSTELRLTSCGPQEILLPLRQSTCREVPRGAGELNTTATPHQHAPRRRLSNQEAAEGRDHEGRRHLPWIDVYQGTRHAPAGVEYHQVRGSLGRIHIGEQSCHVLGLGRIAGHGTRAGFGYQRRQFARVTRGQHDLSAPLRKRARQSGAQPLTRADDKRYF
jgi:hypothetical protein